VDTKRLDVLVPSLSIRSIAFRQQLSELITLSMYIEPS
jgi:hypothetical protein